MSVLEIWLPSALARCGSADLDRAAARRGMLIALGHGTIGGNAAALLLTADVAAASRESRIRLDSAEAMAAAVWRSGRDVFRALDCGATEALRSGLLDELVEGEPGEAWVEEWLGTRSVSALASTAALIRLRGGNALERAEFARLFATGEPQSGVGAFLLRTPAQFPRGTVTVRR